MTIDDIFVKLGVFVEIDEFSLTNTQLGDLDFDVTLEWKYTYFVLNWIWQFTLFNELLLELNVYCGPDTFYGLSNFGQYDKEKNIGPF